MKKNEEKIFLAGMLSVALFVGAGCIRAEQNNPVGGNQNIATTTKYDTAKANMDQSQKKFTIDDLTMTVPNKYVVSKVEGSKVWIKTDDKKYDVKLVAEFKKMKFDDLKKETASSNPEAVLKNGAIYSDGCNGFACYNLLVGQKAYLVLVDIDSSEEAPQDLDGVWSPSTVATQDDMLSILKTVEIK